MIRYARKLLDAVFFDVLCGRSPARKDVEELADLSDQLFDAAEVALAPEYDVPPIVVDTREQRPFSPFLWQKGRREYLPPERLCFAEGDYSSPLLLEHVRIERKSISDLYGSLFGTSVDALGESAPNQERLRAEFLRLSRYPRAYFVIEGMPQDLAYYIQSRERRVQPGAAYQLVESMGFDYGVPVRWNRNRESAEWFVGYILSRAHAQATSATEAKKSRKRGLSLPWAKP
jgi:ERCC4-type nuclease